MFPVFSSIGCVYVTCVSGVVVHRLNKSFGDPGVPSGAHNDAGVTNSYKAYSLSVSIETTSYSKYPYSAAFSLALPLVKHMPV